jgi:hypothetical protein
MDGFDIRDPRFAHDILQNASLEPLATGAGSHTLDAIFPKRRGLQWP